MTSSVTTPSPSEPATTADIRLVMIDIDGTLCGQSNQVDPVVIAAIAKALQ